MFAPQLSLGVTLVVRAEFELVQKKISLLLFQKSQKIISHTFNLRATLLTDLTIVGMCWKNASKYNVSLAEKKLISLQVTIIQTNCVGLSRA